MPVERASAATSLIDVLDRVLDKGIVIDAWVRMSVVGIDLITVEARVIVASIATYLQYSDPIYQMPAVARPVLSTGVPSAVGVSRRRYRRPRATGQAPDVEAAAS
jgi:hypothetical protein